MKAQRARGDTRSLEAEALLSCQPCCTGMAWCSPDTWLLQLVFTQALGVPGKRSSHPDTVWSTQVEQRVGPASSAVAVTAELTELAPRKLLLIASQTCYCCGSSNTACNQVATPGDAPRVGQLAQRCSLPLHTLRILTAAAAAAS